MGGAALPWHEGAEGSVSLGFLSSPEFQLLLSATARRPMLKSELDRRFVPDGYTADEIWEALTAIRRGQAFYGPIVEFTPEGVRKNWHTVPATLQYSLRQIARKTQRGSFLDLLISERAGCRFVTQYYIEEAVANLKHDGFETDYESVRAAIFGERACMTFAEQLAVNFHSIMRDLPAYEELPFDESVIMRLYQDLTEGLSDEDLPAPGTVSLLDQHVVSARDNGVLDIIVATGNDLNTEPVQDPIMVSMLVNCHFWRLSPLPSCNNLMGCIASRFYLFKKGLPAFRFLPKTKILEDWSMGSSFSGSARYSLRESIVADGAATDWTAYYDSFMSIMLHMLQLMEESLANLKESDDLILACIAASDGFNHRQKTLLKRAVLAPETEFAISEHRAAHGIAYSTARIDFEDLVARGLLVRTTRATANVYLSAPDLRVSFARLIERSASEKAAL